MTAFSNLHTKCLLGLGLVFALMLTACPAGNLPPLTGSVLITIEMGGEPVENAAPRAILTAHTDASLHGSGDVSFQWRRGNTNIPHTRAYGEPEDPWQYLVQDGDVGQYISVVVTRSGNSGAIVSAPIFVGREFRVDSVSVNPSRTDLRKGGERTFAAIVEGTNNPPQTVAWSIDGHGGSTSSGSIIDQSGRLRVSATETLPTLTIRAASTAAGFTQLSGTATVTLLGHEITGVVVNPLSVYNIPTGGIQGFAATVKGTGNPPQAVEWSIYGWGISTSAGSTIDPNGILRISATETLDTFTVRATSTLDGAGHGDAAVRVLVPVATGIEVSPAGNADCVEQGGTLGFTATVTGNPKPLQHVIWSIGPYGTSTVHGTIIHPGGRLMVSMAEPYDTTLTIRATWTVDPSISGEALVRIAPHSGDMTPRVTAVTVNPVYAYAAKGGTQDFTAVVSGNNSPPQDVTWSIVETGRHWQTTINSDTGTLMVAPAETLERLTIRATSMFDATIFGYATVTVPPPIVTGLTVIPATAVVPRGGADIFAAVVAGANDPPQGVSWSIVEAGRHLQTTINPDNGLLTVAAMETLGTLTIRAASTFDATIFGYATVTVPVPTPSEVTLNPRNVDVARGGIQGFTAIVTGINSPLSQDLIWSINGLGTSTADGTTIDSYGRLTIAANEPLGTLTIRAASTLNTAIFGEATANVVDIPEDIITDVRISPPNAVVRPGETRGFTALVGGTNNPPQNVTWSIAGHGTSTSAGSSIDPDGLLRVAAGEGLATLTVRATSKANTEISDQVTVTVALLSSVTRVVVYPIFETVERNGTQGFTALVAGIGNPPQNVTWYVWPRDGGTSISQNGLLTVGSMAPGLLTLRATAVGTTIYGTATVTVPLPPDCNCRFPGNIGDCGSGCPGNNCLCEPPSCPGAGICECGKQGCGMPNCTCRPPYCPGDEGCGCGNQGCGMPNCTCQPPYCPGDEGCGCGNQGCNLQNCACSGSDTGYITVEIGGVQVETNAIPNFSVLDPAPTVTVTNASQFDNNSIRWFVGNSITPIHVGPSLVLGAAVHGNRIGQHYITVEGTVNGVPFSRHLSFRVEM